VTVDSITKADGMEGVRLVRFPGSVRVVLDEDTVAIVAHALDRYAADLDRGAQGRVGETWDIQRGEAGAAALLAEVLRGSAEVCADMDKNDDDTHGLMRALVNAGAQA
jgi:hypothetical protein